MQKQSKDAADDPKAGKRPANDGEDDNQTPPAKKTKLGSDKGKDIESEAVVQKTRRSKEDEKAQKKVPEWYGDRCIFTGAEEPQGAPIIAVGVEIASQDDLGTFWDSLSLFWAGWRVKKWREELEISKGHEWKNIFPLRPDARNLWDRRHFAIRPIRDPKEPNKKLHVQMVWLEEFNKRNGMDFGRRDQRARGSIVDWRRGDDVPAVVETGDLYELVTSDPTRYPLPSYELLQMQYTLHKLLLSLKAAGSLRTIFKDDPPSVDPIPANMTVPSEWAWLLDGATKAGVMDSDAAAKWGHAFALVQREKDEEEEERYQELLQELGLQDDTCSAPSTPRTPSPV
ncbi:hypothetical protein QBC46DRAFT_385399 [Diplogelasinospora grovesii]|uniref:HNH nuclease domain-containing protein n=1 Tax=Diplogelasinospora grovesii TaxID=303347 RepID=A0AAN6N771_9PEZI|nr:hypothetical protein QBC46DRAFT_385399 [Diplogelasinospora grovesii]